MDKMNTEDKINAMLFVKERNYFLKNGKEYASSTKSKLKCEIKEMIKENKHLSWEFQKNLLYFTNSIDFTKLDHLDSIERKYKTQIDHLNEKIFGMTEVYKSQRINMRDTIKKEYEETFIKQYSTEKFEELQYRKDNLYEECCRMRKIQQEQSHRYDQKKEDELSGLKFQVAELTLQLGSDKEKSKGKIKNKDYKAKYKVLKLENSKLKSKVIALEQKNNVSSDDESSSDSSD